MDRMTLRRSATFARPGSNSIRTIFVAALKCAADTPETDESAFSIAGGQWSQVIPPIRSARLSVFATPADIPSVGGSLENCLREVCAIIACLFSYSRTAAKAARLAQSFLMRIWMKVTSGDLTHINPAYSRPRYQTGPTSFRDEWVARPRRRDPSPAS